MGKRRYDYKKGSKSIGLKVRRLREGRHWTLEATEEHGWETSWQELQKIESGRNITIRTLVRLAQLFDVHPASLLEDL